MNESASMYGGEAESIFYFGIHTSVSNKTFINIYIIDIDHSNRTK